MNKYKTYLSQTEFILISIYYNRDLHKHKEASINIIIKKYRFISNPCLYKYKKVSVLPLAHNNREICAFYRLINVPFRCQSTNESNYYDKYCYLNYIYHIFVAAILVVEDYSIVSIEIHNFCNNTLTTAIS